MRILVSEKLSPHKMKTPEGYLICTDAILSRTGKQTYRRSEIWGDSCDNANQEIEVDRRAEEVFNDKTLASFENKPICIEHPDEDVNVNNHNSLSVGFVRDIKRGKVDSQDVMLGTLVITNADAVEAVERGDYTELSCGYNCDVIDEDNPQQRNIRGNHVALCERGRAGIARIVDSVEDAEEDDIKYGYKDRMTGVYDKWYRYNRKDGGRNYDLGQKLAAKEKNAPENVYFIEVMHDSPDFESKSGRQQTYEHEIQVGLSKANIPTKRWNKSGYKFNIDNTLTLIATSSGIECKTASTSTKCETSDDVAKFIRQNLGDSKMKDVRSTNTSGTDKIIYVMQSDIDKNLYFYIGKTFSMKEGSWGYSKYEMDNTTPEQLKADLSKNGWHQVSQGVARIIDTEHEVITDEIMKDASRQTLIEKLRTVSVPYGERYALTSGSGWHIDIQHHGRATYENVDKHRHVSPKESSLATIRLWHNGEHMKTFEGALNVAKSDAIKYLQTRIEDSHTDYFIPHKYSRTFFNKRRAEEFAKQVNGIIGGGTDAFGQHIWIVKWDDSIEKLYDISYVKDGVTYVNKVRASSMQEAIKKVEVK